MLRRIALVVAGLAVGAAPGLAEAGGSKQSGALGKVTSSVARQTGSSGGSRGASSGSNSGSSSGSSDNSGSHTDDSRTHRSHYVNTYPYQCVGCGPVVISRGGPAGAHSPHPTLTETSLELSLASIQDSDGAARGAFRVMSGRLGIGIQGTHYFEKDRGGSDEWIRLNLWSVLGAGTIVDTGRTRLTVSGGLAGTSSTAFERILGPTVGVELEHDLSTGSGVAISPGASARAYIFEKDVSATELYLGARISQFAIGWRYLVFNGESTPLQGPEVGVSARF